MNDVLTHRTEDPLQHVVEMYADIGSYTSRLMHIAFPTAVIPLTTRGDISEVNIIHFIFRSLLNLLLEGSNRVVQTQLEDSVSLMTRLSLQLHEVVDIIRVEHQGFLTYHIDAEAQTIADEGIVSVVRRTYTQPVERLGGAHLLRAETVELLVLSIERAVRERTVEPSDGVELIVCYHQVVTCIGYRLNVPRSYITCSTYQCKIFHLIKF